MIKQLWWLVPIVVGWVLWAIGYNILPSDALEVWWAMPLFVTMLAMFVASVSYAVDKVTDP